MKYRKLGQRLEVSAIGIECMPMIRGGNISIGPAGDDVSLGGFAEANWISCWPVPKSRGSTASKASPFSRIAIFTF